MAKINENGDWQWASRIGGTTANIFGRGVAVLDTPSGAIITGYFGNEATFGGFTLTTTSLQDIFVAKIDAAGTWQWASQAGGTGLDQAEAVSVLADGSAIVTGYFSNTASFGDPTLSLTSLGSRDIFVAKIDATGTWQWASRAGGTGADQAEAVSVLADGSAIVTGSFSTTASFGNTLSLTSAGSRDIFVAKIDATGTWQWASQAGGQGFDDARGVSVFSVGPASGSAIITGDFAGTAIFGEAELTSAGGADVFVARVTASGAFD